MYRDITATHEAIPVLVPCSTDVRQSHLSPLPKPDESTTYEMCVRIISSYFAGGGSWLATRDILMQRRRNKSQQKSLQKLLKKQGFAPTPTVIW